MAVVLEAVDLAALCAEALAWALLTVLVVLLAKLVSKLHFHIDLGIVSFEPLGWLADALASYLLAGAEDARQAVEGAMKATYDGLTWSFNEMLGLFTDLANATKGVALYLWQHVVKPWTQALIRPLEATANKAEAAVTSLAKTVASDFTKVEAYAEAQATKAVTSAEAFTKSEISAARQDYTALSAAITARLDGIGTQAASIAGDVAATPGIVWDDLKKYLDVKNLADATLLGMLGALGIHALTDTTGLDKSNCQQNQKQVCNADPGQWLKLLEGIALLGVAFDFKLLYDFAESIITDVGDLVVKIEDVAWSEFGG